MTDTNSLIALVYAAFNRRDIDAVFAYFNETVSWPKASEGGRALGKEQIRAYWTRQWKDFDPYVEPIEVDDRGAGQFHVRVRQVVKSLTGEILSDSEVSHVYQIADGLIGRMDIGAMEDSPQSPSSAFSRH